MAEENAASMGEDVDFVCMVDEDNPNGRNDATMWLRKRVGVVAARDLPAEPSEEDCRQGLRSGMILCKVLNQIQPGSVPKVINAPSPVCTTPDAKALAAYLENVKNFLKAIEALGLPPFEPSDLEPGGYFSRVVNTVLALKAYNEWKAKSGNASRKFSWSSSPSWSFLRRNLEAVKGGAGEHSWDEYDDGSDPGEEVYDFGPLYKIVSDLLMDREEEDIPIIVENMLNKLKEEFEARLTKETKRLNGELDDSNSGEDDACESESSSPDYEAVKEQERINREKEMMELLKEKARRQLEDEEAERAAKEQERIRKEKELLEQQERARKEVEERAAREQERIKREKERELLEQQERARMQEEADKVAREQALLAREQARIQRQKEKEKAKAEKKVANEKAKAEKKAAKEKAKAEKRAKKEQERMEMNKDKEKAKEEKKAAKEQERLNKEKERENAKKKREEEKAAKDQERAKREMEKEKAKKQAEAQREAQRAAKEQERIKREKELLALQEKANMGEKESLQREKELLALQEKARKDEERERLEEEKRAKEEEERERLEEIERAKMEELERQEEEERLRKQEENDRLDEEARARQDEERERLEEEERKRKEEESERKEEEDEKARQEAEEKAEKEKERLEKDEELREQQERERRQEEYRKRMENYKRLTANTVKRKELVERQDKDLEGLRSTISTAKTEVHSWKTACQEDSENLGGNVRTLCQAAAGYKKVLEENRKLYNQVQDLKGSIRVYCRIRPPLPGQENRPTHVDYTDDETVTIIIPTKSGKEGRKASMFNKVFGPSSTQAEVFTDTQPLIRSVLDGFNICVFAYGQTESGKTYTLTGPDDLNEETMGASLRALNDLFLISEERQDLTAYTISINMLEIYNDEIRDLLTPDGSNKIYPYFHISTYLKKNSFFCICFILTNDYWSNVPDANLVPVSSTEEVIKQINIAKKNSGGNNRSSRAHNFLTVHVVGKDKTSGSIVRGCMHLVDLAGSEKMDSSNDESAHISKSLSALGDTLVALATKAKTIPFKSCKLTLLLQDALAAQAKILIFVHVHPDADEAGETFNTFKYIERFSTVEGGCGKSAETRELKEQVAYYKAALARRGEAGEIIQTDVSNISFLDYKDQTERICFFGQDMDIIKRFKNNIN
ncbi:hypothetical protein LXL04_007784 [Taraxacum kok-saghyz]